MKERKYSEQINIENEQKLRALVAELPQFCREYFIGIEPSTSSRTRIAYAYDLVFSSIVPQPVYIKAMRTFGIAKIP